MDLSTNLGHRLNLLIFLCLAYCCSGASLPATSSRLNNILDAIVACDSVQFLRNSSYVSQCNRLPYPVDLKESQEQDQQERHFMCITLNHITSTICQYPVTDKTLLKLPENASRFDEQMRLLEPNHQDRLKTVGSWCQNMPVLLNASILNDSNPVYIKYANESLLDKTECVATCQVRRGVNPFCVVFSWFDQLYRTLLLTKKPTIAKDTAVSQPKLDQIDTDDNLEKPLINADKNDEHTSIVNAKLDKEQPKLPIPDMDIPNNMKAELTANVNEQDMKKTLDESEHEAIPDRQQQRQDSKLSSSTDDKLNLVESKVENPKTDFQEGNDDFFDKDGKKAFEDVAEVDNEHGIMETNKKDSNNDSGDQRGFLDSPVMKEEEESHFFVYFSVISLACVILYIGYHNKQKILAMVLEGRQSRRSRGSRRRPNTANYRKLDSNLEEAVTSQCNSNVTHVIY